MAGRLGGCSVAPQWLGEEKRNSPQPESENIMQNIGIHGGGISPINVRRVWFTGTTVVKEGYPLCYNFDATDESAEGATISLADSLGPTSARRLQVEFPGFGNEMHFAGVVSEKSNGVTGPGWVEINCPGSICNIFTSADGDHEDGTGINSGQILGFTVQAAIPEFKYAAIPGAGAALVLGDVDRSSTSALVMAELCVGQPSGGVQVLNSLTYSTVAAFSTGGTASVTQFGRTTLANTAGTAAAISVVLTAGLNIGQRKVINTGSLAVSDGINVHISQAVRVNTTVTVPTNSAVDMTACLSAVNEVLDLVWNGTAWELTVTGVVVIAT